MNDRQRAGLVLFIGSAQFLIALLIAEALYPGYSISNNYISDLGVGPEPSKTIFNASVFIFGLLGAAGAALLLRAKGDRVVPFLLLASGLGAMGVGLIHEDVRPYHTIVAALAFGAGGLGAVFSYRMVDQPVRYAALVLGVMSLAALVLMGTGTYLGLGKGGMERMILYPAIAWILGLGAWLSAQDESA